MYIVFTPWEKQGGYLTGVIDVTNKITGYRKAGHMGNSIGVGIPKEIVDALKIKAGDEFKVTADPNTNRITMIPVSKIPLSGGLTPEMEEIVEEIFEKYDETLKGLKER